MRKVKQVFPSRNYITIDTQGDIEIVFNPVGDGTEGDDKLTFRRGRWAFRCNDFLAGKMLPNGENESMNRKIYSLNVVYDDENGEPIIDTTYVDPTSVIPLDGSLVTIGNGNWVKKVDLEELFTDVRNNATSVSNVKFKVDSITTSIQEVQEFIKTIPNYAAFGNRYNILVGAFPIAQRFKCNIQIDFANAALILIGADCSCKEIVNGHDFIVLNCDKVVRLNRDKTAYYKEIFTQNNFLYFRDSGIEKICECHLRGVDMNGVFADIYNNNGDLPVNFQVIL